MTKSILSRVVGTYRQRDYDVLNSYSAIILCRREKQYTYLPTTPVDLMLDYRPKRPFMTETIKKKIKNE